MSVGYAHSFMPNAGCIPTIVCRAFAALDKFCAGFGEVVEASALAMSVCEELPPPDTVVGSLKFASGKPASVSISFAGSVLRFSLSVTGTKGSLEASSA